jgi:hypothetical protein
MLLNFSDLVGHFITSIYEDEYYGNDAIYIILDNGEKYALSHKQDCCENVSLEEIDGCLEDLIGEKILVAYESSQAGDPTSYGTSTWTFYNLMTNKGYLNLRFYGTSNGYYSENAHLIYIGEGYD